LFSDFPVLKGIDVTTLGAVPCPFLRVGIPLVHHLDDEMAMQAHRWFTVDILLLNCLAHGVDPPFKFLATLAIRLPGHDAAESTTSAAFPLDGQYLNRVEIPARGEK